MPRTKSKDELPAKQERALLALLNEPSIEKAAITMRSSRLN
jgi:hypothetical protein